MSVNDVSRIVKDDLRVSLQIVASHTDDTRGVIYNLKMLEDRSLVMTFKVIYKLCYKLSSCSLS